jgi:RNA polymerase sigma-70 factor (ECF subfamily)
MNSYPETVKGVRKNETQSQMKFYDLFVHPVYRSALAITGNSDEAEEIAQDTLLKVFSNPHLLHDDIRAMTRILRRIATNQAIDTLRRRKDFFISIEEEQQTPDCEEEEEEIETAGLTVTDIREAIDRLPSACRSILSLRLFEEISFAEIAERLQANASTVRVQYVRGIAKLKDCLKQKINDYEQYA